MIVACGALNRVLVYTLYPLLYYSLLCSACIVNGLCPCVFYNVIGATVQDFAFYGQGTGLIVLDDLACTGSESSLFSCDHRGINSHNCGHFEDVGVTCMGKNRYTILLWFSFFFYLNCPKT